MAWFVCLLVGLFVCLSVSGITEKQNLVQSESRARCTNYFSLSLILQDRAFGLGGDLDFPSALLVYILIKRILDSYKSFGEQETVGKLVTYKNLLIV